MEFLVLEVNDARYGIPTSDVREVLRAVRLGPPSARLPNMLGMLNYRGQVLGVLELTCLRQRSNRELTPHDHLIVLQFDRQMFAVRVDQAIEIMTWSEAGEIPPEDASPNGAPQPFTSIAHPDWGLVHLLETSLLWSELQREHVQQSTQEVEAGA